MSRSLSSDIRHTVGTLAVCVVPWAYVFDFCTLRFFGLAMTAGLTLLISTVPPKPKRRP